MRKKKDAAAFILASQSFQRNRREQKTGLLMALLATYTEHTGHPVEEVELVERQISANKIGYRFVPKEEDREVMRGRLLHLLEAHTDGKIEATVVEHILNLFGFDQVTPTT